MNRYIVFVTHEFDPIVSGGAGTVVAELARRLVASGHAVTVVLAAPTTPGSIPDGVDVVVVPDAASDGSLVSFVDRSRRIAEALADLAVSRGLPDLIEFHDFDIPAWWTLTHREELGLSGTRIGIRLHGPVGAMTEAMGFAPPPMGEVGELEGLLFGMADLVMVPSESMRSWSQHRYALDGGRIVLAPVPIPDVAPLVWSPAATPEFVAYGRLNEVKGSHDLVAASGALFERHPEARIRFVGRDGWSASEDRPMSQMLADLIPRRHRNRFTFEGPLPRDSALAAMGTAWAVIVPSRFESFCISLHEARRAGLPVIAASLPAFEEFRSGAGVLLYDGSVAGLASTLVTVASDPSILARLAREPAPEVGDPVAAYAGSLPEVRHPRSQAGLATAATKRAESMSTPRVSAAAAMARRLLRSLPDPVARVAIRVVPRRFKGRFRGLASWPEEVARRRRARSLSGLRGRVAAGRIPEHDPPRVSVVIPCFEQGSWVEDAVASVFDQTFDSWEIVLVDDGSTDPATIRLLDEIAGWPRVRLVRQDNQGLPAARNAGIARSAGEFIVPLDADDALVPEYLAEMVAALASHPEAAFAHCWAWLFGDVDAVWVPRPFNRYWQRLSNGVVGCVLLRKAAWEAVGGYDETMRRGHEDWELWTRLEASGWGQVRVDRALFRYRKHGVSMSVGSEAGFEAGLAEVRARNPQLYTRVALEILKREWYPFVSLIVDATTEMVEPPPPDVTTVESPRSAVGKYVVDVRGRSCRPADVVRLAETLETAPTKAGAVGRDGVIVWRRWALVDPNAEVAGVLGADSIPAGTLRPDVLGDPEWMVDPAGIPDGVRVMRQRPEEAGRLPGWVVVP